MFCSALLSFARLQGRLRRSTRCLFVPLVESCSAFSSSLFPPRLPAHRSRSPSFPLLHPARADRREVQSSTAAAERAGHTVHNAHSQPTLSFAPLHRSPALSCTHSPAAAHREKQRQNARESRRPLSSPLSRPASASRAMSDSSAPAATSAAVLVCCRCNKSPAAKCGLCKAVAYCGKACQAKDWELGHKARCKELRKEAAAAAAAGAGDLAAANSAGKSKSSSASASALAPPPSSSPAPLESTDLDSSPSIDLARPSQWLYAPPSLRDLFDPRGAGALTIPRRPVGLRNPKQANSCFLNVVLQSLTYTAPLANWLETLNHARDACVVSKSGKYCALCALDSHHHLVRERYAEALTARSQSPAVAGPLVCKPILPVEILKNLSALNSDYMLGQQEDSHQTTEHLLHLIDESWRKNAAAQEAATAAAAAVEAQANAAPLAADASAEGSDSSSSSSTAVTPSPAPAPASSPAPARPLSQRTLETTPISQLFGGYLLSQLKCGFPDCNRVSSSFEHFLDLSLELIEATDDLGEMLEAFSRIERLDERNKWQVDTHTNTNTHTHTHTH